MACLARNRGRVPAYHGSTAILAGWAPTISAPVRLRLYSKSNVKPTPHYDADDIQKARAWLSALDISKLPTSNYFDISYARSSGPGGQNVNKVSSKATLKLDSQAWRNAHWIPAPVLAQLHSSFPYKMKTGGIVIQSDRTRSRESNLKDCFEKLVAGIKESVYFAPEVQEKDIERWAGIKRKNNEKRLKEKLKNGEKKQSRRKSFDD